MIIENRQYGERVPLISEVPPLILSGACLNFELTDGNTVTLTSTDTSQQNKDIRHMLVSFWWRFAPNIAYDYNSTANANPGIRIQVKGSSTATFVCRCLNNDFYIQSNSATINRDAVNHIGLGIDSSASSNYKCLKVQIDGGSNLVPHSVKDVAARWHHFYGTLNIVATPAPGSKDMIYHNSTNMFLGAGSRVVPVPSADLISTVELFSSTNATATAPLKIQISNLWFATSESDVDEWNDPEYIYNFNRYHMPITIKNDGKIGDIEPDLYLKGENNNPYLNSATGSIMTVTNAPSVANVINELEDITYSINPQAVFWAADLPGTNSPMASGYAKHFTGSYRIFSMQYFNSLATNTSTSTFVRYVDYRSIQRGLSSVNGDWVRVAMVYLSNFHLTTNDNGTCSRTQLEGNEFMLTTEGTGSNDEDPISAPIFLGKALYFDLDFINANPDIPWDDPAALLRLFLDEKTQLPKYPGLFGEKIFGSKASEVGNQLSGYRYNARIGTTCFYSFDTTTYFTRLYPKYIGSTSTVPYYYEDFFGR